MVLPELSAERVDVPASALMVTVPMEPAFHPTPATSIRSCCPRMKLKALEWSMSRPDVTIAQCVDVVALQHEFRIPRDGLLLQGVRPNGILADLGCGDIDHQRVTAFDAT